MSLYTEAKKEAIEAGVEVGKLTVKKDRLGYYDVLEDGLIVAESMLADNADDAKASYIDDLLAKTSDRDWL